MEGVEVGAEARGILLRLLLLHPDLLLHDLSFTLGVQGVWLNEIGIYRVEGLGIRVLGVG